jgi:hypothetical protein
MNQITIGGKFGRLTILQKGKIVGRNRYWLCSCECGKAKEIAYSSLSKGATKSCGCLNAELASARKKTHGKSKSSEYFIWLGMHQRCNDKNCKAYGNYGGRGITVCSEWSGNNGFETFLSHMGVKPKNASIERRDNNGNYCAENCIWATYKEQANNRRTNVNIEFNGTRKTIQQLSEEYQIPYFTLRARIVVLNWPIERALTEKIRRKPTTA